MAKQDKEDLKRTIQLPESGEKTIMVRQGGHFTEQMLISDKDAHALLEDNQQIFNRDLFKDFNEKNNAKVIKEIFEVEDIGYKLTPQENRLVTAIRSELFNKSENTDTNSERYYMGNYFPNGEVVKTNFSAQTMTVPHLLVSRGDLYKAFLGKDRYSGQDQKDIDKLLRTFSQRYFLTIYKQHVIIKNETKINRITEYLPLVRLKRLDKGLSEIDDSLLDQGGDFTNNNGEYLLAINPIWVDQIKTKWVEFPHDLNTRLGNAIGHWNKITPATTYLINYLFHQRSTKNFVTEINEDNLFIKLGLDKYIKRRKRKLAESYLEESIRISKEIKLCQKAEKTTGAQGQVKWVFEINETI
jgi:hypothetical protein